MYKAFFGFTKNPFNMSPDPSFLFRSAQHEEALANLIYGVQSRKGFIVLTGEVGTGKTTMLECLRDFLNAQQIAFASLFNSRLTVEQFFELLAYDLDLRCNRLSKTEVLLSLNNMLIERANVARTTVLIVDEAHNLEWDVLEEIRLLGNLENRKGKLLQIVLAGQQELDRKLDAPEFRQLKQRISLRCALRGFDLGETVAYVNSRMARAGRDPLPGTRDSPPHQRYLRQPVAHRVRHGEPNRHPGNARRGDRRYAPRVPRPTPLPARCRLPPADFAPLPSTINGPLSPDIRYLPYILSSPKNQ
jgi:general secretion pathway protein A